MYYSVVLGFWWRIAWRRSPCVLRRAQRACAEGRGMVENSQSIAPSTRGAAQLNVTYLSIISSSPPGDKDEASSKTEKHASRDSRSYTASLYLNDIHLDVSTVCLPLMFPSHWDQRDLFLLFRLCFPLLTINESSQKPINTGHYGFVNGA